MRSSTLIVALALLGLVAAAVSAQEVNALLVDLAAQEGRPPAEQPPVFRAATDLTLVRFQLIRDHHFVGGLRAADIRVLDNGAERDVELFEGGCGASRTRPVDVVLLFDLSGSVMNLRLLDWVVYRDVFVRPFPSARIGVYGFSNTLSRFSPPTVDPDQLRDAIGRVVRSNENRALAQSTVALALPPKRSARSDWKSWIFEAVLATAREASTPGATRVIVLLTDGVPSTTTTEDDVAPEIQSLGVSVFPLFVNDGVRSRSVPLASVVRLAKLTGGRSFAPPTFSEDTVRTVLQIVSESIRCEYVVGIAPSPAPGAPKRHDIEVRLRSKAMGRLWGGKRTIRY